MLRKLRKYLLQNLKLRTNGLKTYFHGYLIVRKFLALKILKAMTLKDYMHI